MSHQLDLDRDLAVASTDQATTDLGVPGRRSTSAGMTGPTTPIASGILQRRADGNGVHANADAAVATAASSSGSALPATLQRKFEGSLGTDLSSVRVHTGASSAAAAAAVGAKAYTMGNDIHFGAGHFDPASASGQHLLAHEIAHTVQQRGGSPTRQNKLEVSTPGDQFEREADRAADSMVSGAPVSLAGGGSGILSRDTEVKFDEDYQNPSSQMRADGEKAAKVVRGSRQSTGDSVTADISQADVYINRIEAARGPLGQLKGREDAMNADKAQAGAKEQAAYIPQMLGARRIAQNTAVAAQLTSFKSAASKQSFQHSFFAPQYAQLQEDFVRLKASVEIIKSQNLKVIGDDAKSDVNEAKKANPLVAQTIGELKTAITDLSNTAGNAESGLAAIAEKAGGTFDHLNTATDEMKLPLPKLNDTKEQAAANAGVAAVNADLEAAKSTIATVKVVVDAAISIATGGLGAAAVPQIDKVLTKMGDTATDAIEKFNAKGAVAPGKAAASAVQGDLEGKLAAWITNYNTRIASANGKVTELNSQISEKQAAIATSKVQNLQSQLMKEVGRFALLMKQVAEKKAAVADAAKKVQEQTKKAGKHGTDIGAAAQAMASVSTFLVQADAAEQIGKKEKEQGDSAKKTMQGVTGDYQVQRTPGWGGGSDGLAETHGGDEARYYECKVAGDADARGDTDLSGYDITENKVKFTINEDDKNERSRVMSDRTDPKLENIAKWKAETKEFETALADALGMGPSKMP